MKITEIMNITKNLHTPWSIHFEPDGTEDVAILHDANGDELATSRHFWLSEGDDPIPATLLAMRLMEAAPELSEVLESLIDQIRSLEGESSVIDEDLMQGEAFKEAVILLASLEPDAKLKHEATAEELEKNRQIAFSWSIEDVQEIRPDLDDDQAWEVLRAVKQHENSYHGITWDTLESIAEMFYPQSDDE